MHSAFTEIDATRLKFSKSHAHLRNSEKSIKFDHTGLVFFLSRLDYQPSDPYLPSYRALHNELHEDQSFKSMLSGEKGVRYESASISVNLTKSELLDLFSGHLAPDFYLILFKKFPDAPELLQYDCYKEFSAQIWKKEFQKYASRQSGAQLTRSVIERKLASVYGRVPQQLNVAIPSA